MIDRRIDDRGREQGNEKRYKSHKHADVASRAIRCSVIFCVLCLEMVGCQKPLYQETQFIMGTFVEVKSSDVRAAAIVFDEFKKLDAIFISLTATASYRG
jgi:hypothetical protein